MGGGNSRRSPTAPRKRGGTCPRSFAASSARSAPHSISLITCEPPGLRGSGALGTRGSGGSGVRGPEGPGARPRGERAPEGGAPPQPSRPSRVGGELRCKGKREMGTLRGELFFPGGWRLRPGRGLLRPQGPPGRPRRAVGPARTGGGRAVPARVPAPVLHLPSSRPCAAPPGSGGPLGPRPRPGCGAGIAGGAVR